MSVQTLPVIPLAPSAPPSDLGVCAACKFVDKTQDPFVCRQRPPIVTARTHDAGITAWPTVKPDDWCGGWTKKL